MKDKSVNGWISDELNGHLSAHCERNGLSKSTFIRTIIYKRIKNDNYSVFGGDTGTFDCSVNAWIDEDSYADLKRNIRGNMSKWLRDAIYDEL